MDKFNYKKSLGQNFLKDDNICNKIVDSALIDKDTLVIEIGPGHGAISKYIVSKCKYFVMYEIDERLKDYLISNFSKYDNVELIFNDFMKENIKKTIEKYDYKKLFVVANVPYYITTPIISKFIDESIIPDKFVIMIQKEVADRLSAKVGSKEYSSFTVFLNYYYNIKKLFDVNRNCFQPVPNVDSSIICMDKILDNKEVFDISLFNRIVRESFKFKRKTIRNNLKNYNLNIISDVLNKYNFDLNVRAEELSLDIFIDIANSLYNK